MEIRANRGPVEFRGQRTIRESNANASFDNDTVQFSGNHSANSVKSTAGDGSGDPCFYAASTNIKSGGVLPYPYDACLGSAADVKSNYDSTDLANRCVGSSTDVKSGGVLPYPYDACFGSATDVKSGGVLPYPYDACFGSATDVKSGGVLPYPYDACFGSATDVKSNLDDYILAPCTGSATNVKASDVRVGY